MIRTDPPHGPVRVCYVIDQLSRAGTESQLLALIRHCDRRRVEPSLVLLRDDDAADAGLEPPDCPTLRLGFTSFRRPAALWQAARLARFFQRRRVDVVQTYFLDSTYLGATVARMSGVRKVVRVRNNAGYWLTPAHRALSRACARLVDVTLTNSEEGRLSLVRSDGRRQASVEVLENGVDLGRFASAAPASADVAPTVRVGVVANLRPVKDLGLLVRAAGALAGRHPRVEFQVAGEGPERPALERMIADARLGRRFRLLGAVADVPAFLARQDVAVLCSRSEGMSNALMEYMAAGRAVVATRVGAAERLIDDGVHGLLVEPGDADGLTAALERLLTEPGLSRRLGEAARQRARERFGREAMCERFAAFYERLCRRPRFAAIA